MNNKYRLPTDWLTTVRYCRRQGLTWPAIAAGFGCTADYIRIAYGRHTRQSQPAEPSPQLPQYDGLDNGSRMPVFHSPRRRKHLIIPDTQVRAGVPLDHFYWIGQYIAHKKPDVVIHMGDWLDMASISSYDIGRIGAEGKRFTADIASGRESLELFEAGMDGYEPELKLFVTGNHEYRIERYVADHPALEGALTLDGVGWEAAGWQRFPFLQPIDVDGVLYAHFFPRSANGRVFQTTRGAPSAKAQIQRAAQSATAGHTPGLEVANLPVGNRLLRGLIAGSCYLHDEEYPGPQGNCYWRGIIMKHGVSGGEYNIMEVDLDYLRRKYAQ